MVFATPGCAHVLVKVIVVLFAQLVSMFFQLVFAMVETFVFAFLKDTYDKLLM